MARRARPRNRTIGGFSSGGGSKGSSSSDKSKKVSTGGGTQTKSSGTQIASSSSSNSAAISKRFPSLNGSSSSRGGAQTKAPKIDEKKAEETKQRQADRVQKALEGLSSGKAQKARESGALGRLEAAFGIKSRDDEEESDYTPLAKGLGQRIDEYQDEFDKLFAGVDQREDERIASNEKEVEKSKKLLEKKFSQAAQVLDRALSEAEDQQNYATEKVRGQARISKKNLSAQQRGRARALKGALAKLGALGTTGSAEVTFAVFGENYDIAQAQIDQEANEQVNELNLKYQEFKNKILADKNANDIEKQSLLLKLDQEARNFKEQILSNREVRKAGLAEKAFTFAKNDIDALQAKDDQKQALKQQMVIELIKSGANVSDEIKNELFPDGEIPELASSFFNVGVKDGVSNGVALIKEAIRNSFGVTGLDTDVLQDKVIQGIQEGNIDSIQEGLSMVWDSVYSSPEVKKAIAEIEAKANAARYASARAKSEKEAEEARQHAEAVDTYFLGIKQGAFNPNAVPDKYEPEVYAKLQQDSLSGAQQNPLGWLFGAFGLGSGEAEQTYNPFVPGHLEYDPKDPEDPRYMVVDDPSGFSNQVIKIEPGGDTAAKVPIIGEGSVATPATTPKPKSESGSLLDKAFRGFFK